MRLKFIHAADLHLDSPMRGLPTEGPLWELFRSATFGALERLVDLCIEERADFLVVAGDLFDAKDRSVRARLALKAAMARLGAAGIQAFLVHGNHDPLAPSVGALTLPENVTVFGTAWEEVPVVRGGELRARVQGISYGQERVTEDLSRHFRRVGPEFTLGLLHANVGGHAAHAAYAPCTLADLAARGLDYWALGHVHTRGEYPLPGGARAVYPGNPQGRHVAEPGPRGCVVVEVEGAQSACRFVPLDVVRWHRVELDLGRIAALEAIPDAVEAELSGLEDPRVRAHAVRVVLAGRGPLHRELQAGDALGELAQHLELALKVRRPPVLLESLVDQTRAAFDLSAVEAEGGLAAEVLHAAHGDTAWAGDALRPLKAALKGAGLADPFEDLPHLLERAAQRAVELLWEEP